MRKPELLRNVSHCPKVWAGYNYCFLQECQPRTFKVWELKLKILNAQHAVMKSSSTSNVIIINIKMANIFF